MSQHQICPSCHTEIVWDPEIGPEELCPHCYNPVEEYRTIRIGGAAPASDSPEGEDTEWEPSEDSEEEGLDALDDWDAEDPSLAGYEEAVDAMLDEQEEAQQCERCHEYMILAGQAKISQGDFQPKHFESAGRSFLKAPFTLKTFVCPACFQVSQQLSEEDRLRTVESFLPHNTNK
ncbi:hypothetical protein [Paenibacillus gansuensis]|uniref:Uncharacterized protein n=1 Tax=Paenibacillus gansuensis TaxID=306542 RepID=A0ABW5PH96_9BACL